MVTGAREDARLIGGRGSRFGVVAVAHADSESGTQSAIKNGEKRFFISKGERERESAEPRTSTLDSHHKGTTIIVELMARALHSRASSRHIGQPITF
jgi:hypothetical protein